MRVLGEVVLVGAVAVPLVAAGVMALMRGSRQMGARLSAGLHWFGVALVGLLVVLVALDGSVDANIHSGQRVVVGLSATHLTVTLMALVLGIGAAIVGLIAFICFMERAQRRLLITYPKRQVGNKVYEGQTSFLPLKLNTSGVIPPIFASSLLLLPTTIANFAQSSDGGGVLATIATYLGHGRPLYMLMYISLIVFFAFFYTAIVFNPTETADNLKKHGGFLPGIRPGERTAQFIDQVLTRITVLGAGYLAIICILPEMLISYAALPFYFGGTSLLIVVSVTMDTVAQVHGHLQAQQYEGLVKKAKLRGRKR
jgi:preprotein translocase subunit SecY